MSLSHCTFASGFVLPLSSSELLQSSEFDIQKEAAWAVSNSTSGGTPEQIMYLVSSGVIPPLCNLLSVADAKVITVALEGLENILRISQSANVLERVTEIVNDCGGLQTIEELQNHDNSTIYQRAVKMLETYFGAEEEESEIVPDVVNGAGGHQQFGFGGGSAGPAQFNF